jgi:hypothetical protein
MRLDASKLLGSPQLAAAVVNPKGSAARLVKQAARMGQGAVRFGGYRPDGRDAPDARITFDTPDFGRLGLLTVTAEELALIELKPGFPKMHLIEVIGRARRPQVTYAALDGDWEPPTAIPVTIGFADQNGWQLEISWPQRDRAHAIVDLLAQAA